MNTFRFIELADEITIGVGDSWNNYPVYGATRDGLALAKENVGKNPEKYKLVEPGTIFYNPMRITIGSIAMLDDENPSGITSPDYVAIKPRPGLLHYRWFYHWFRSPAGARFIAAQARGAVRERMLFSRLAPCEISIPTWDEQVEVAKALKDISTANVAIQNQISELNALAIKLVDGD